MGSEFEDMVALGSRKPDAESAYTKTQSFPHNHASLSHAG